MRKVIGSSPISSTTYKNPNPFLIGNGSGFLLYEESKDSKKPGKLPIAAVFPVFTVFTFTIFFSSKTTHFREFSPQAMTAEQSRERDGKRADYSSGPGGHGQVQDADGQMVNITLHTGHHPRLSATQIPVDSKYTVYDIFH